MPFGNGMLTRAYVIILMLKVSTEIIDLSAIALHWIRNDVEIFVFPYYELLTAIYSLRRGRKYCEEIVFAKPWHSFNFSIDLPHRLCSTAFSRESASRRSQLCGTYKKFSGEVPIVCLAQLPLLPFSFLSDTRVNARSIRLDRRKFR